MRVRDQRSKRSRAWPRRSDDQENLRSQTPIGLRNQEFDDHFVNLYGNDYPSMKLIYPALRGGVESGPEEPIEAAPQRFFLLTVGSIGSGMIQLRSIEAFAQSKLADEGYCYVVCGGPEPGFDAVAGGRRQNSSCHFAGQCERQSASSALRAREWVCIAEPA